MTLKKMIAIGVFLAALLIGSQAAQLAILGSVSETKLEGAPALAGAIAPSLTTPDSTGELPQAGKDFVITRAEYFEDRNWAVVHIKHMRDGNSAIVVAQKQNGIYTVVLGPGTSFSKRDVQSAPPAVVSYLTNKNSIAEDIP